LFWLSSSLNFIFYIYYAVTTTKSTEAPFVYDGMNWRWPYEAQDFRI